jgi:tripartite-type tricarboxylate transporter receptor subunit TctC
MANTRFIAVTAALALSALVVPHRASAQSSFYQGKTVAVVIGATGGSLELAARIVTRHLGKHVPGQPNVVLPSRNPTA